MRAQSIRKLLLIVLALGVLLISGGLGYALTPHQLPGLGLSKLNRQFGLWTVTNQSDFQTGVLNNVDVNSSPGDVKIAAPSNWLAGYSYRKSVIVNHADGVYNNTGGTITTYGDYTVHTFTSGGTFTACKAGYVTVLVVGGGGGGGGSDYDCASLGGGGGGGLVYNPSYSVTPGQTYTVVVGAGGAGGSASGNNNGVNGSQSSFGSLTAQGGGGGGGGGLNGLNGGSGGGGGVRTSSGSNGGLGTAGQGKNGGNGYQDGGCNNTAGGGGGGNTSAGSNGAYRVGGNGGAGANYSSIFGAVGGDSGRFGGGGGGGCNYLSTGGAGGVGGGGAGGGVNHVACARADGTSGTANTGGGGGGGASGGSGFLCGGAAAGGNGGSGIVIVCCFTSYFLSDNSQTDYQMQLTVSNSSGVSSGSTVYLNGSSLNWPYDIRFTNSSGTALAYWIESNTSTSATVWVKLDAIPDHPDNGLFYLYYGKAGDTGASNGNNTFIFFDDFNAENATYWSKIGSPTFSDSVLTLPNGASYYTKNAYGTKPFIIEGKYQYPSYYRNRMYDGAVSGVGSPTGYDYGHFSPSIYWNGWTGNNLVINTWYIVRWIDTASNYQWEFLNMDYTINCGPYSHGSSIANTGYLGLQSSESASSIEKWDWVRWRKTATNEPTWGAWAAVETFYPTSWTWRKQVTINNPGSDLTDYQVLVNVSYDSNMRVDFNDIRFTSADGSTFLPYWRENYASGVSAVFWVKVPSVPSGSSSIYLYFGNAGASSASNGSSTFIFFDDFSGDLSKWTKENNGGNISIVSGYLQCGGGSTSPPYGYTVLGSSASYNSFSDRVIEGKVYLTTDSIAEVGYRGNYAANTGYKSRMDTRSGEGIGHLCPPYSGWDFISGCTHSTTPIGIASWKTFSIKVSGTSFSITCDGQTLACTNSSYSAAGEISLQNHYGTYSRFDDIRVRKYASPEPTTSLGANTSYTIGLNSIASAVCNTGHIGARWDLLGWDNASVASTSITFEARASDAQFISTNTTLAWQSISNYPNLYGQYQQWRAKLSTTNGTVTPVLNEVRDLYSWP